MSPLIVEEAIQSERPLVIYYLSHQTPFGMEVSFWCHIYVKDAFKETNGLFVLGANVRPPGPTQVECIPKDVEVMKIILEHTTMKQNLGCVDAKHDSNGTIKIFDWNVRMCGSLTPQIVLRYLLAGFHHDMNKTGK